MKYSLSFSVIGCFIAVVLVNPTLAIQISISPQVDSLYIVGSCTPAEMICTVADSLSDYDTITIRAHYSETLCTDFPPNQSNIIPAFHYIVYDTSWHYRYELWAYPTEYNIDTAYAIKFDEPFMLSPQWYYMVLKVYTDSILIDTAKIKLRSINTGLSVERINNLVPNGIVLKQNFPNPFNPITTIQFSIPQTSVVTIKVYDLLGNEITALVDEEKSIGNYKVEFDGSNLSSGVYFYRMQATPSGGQAGDFIDTKKFVIIK